MNQTIIVILSMVGFIVITSVSVFIYFQEPQVPLSYVGIDCSFANDSLLNYLRNPQCSRPLGVGLLESYQCAFLFNRAGYVKVECEDPNKVRVENGCLYINLGVNNTLAKCP